MRSAGITVKPYTEHLLSKHVHPSYTLKLLSLPITFGSSLYFYDTKLVHTTPKPRIPMHEMTMIGPSAPGKSITIYEPKTNLVKTEEDARVLESNFPTLRTYIRLRYNNPDDPIAFNNPGLGLQTIVADEDDNAEIGQLHILENKVNLSGLMTLEEYLEFLQFHYIQTTEVIGNFEKITTIRGLGKNKSYKRINKHKRKKTRINKRIL